MGAGITQSKGGKLVSGPNFITAFRGVWRIPHRSRQGTIRRSSLLKIILAPVKVRPQ